jgi:uncharacterized protein YmfQ (DUF2313 family)
MPKAPNPTLADWVATTFDLLPRGIAWLRDATSNLGGLVSTYAGERQLLHQRALTLLNTEGVPTAAVELLPDWEQALGLPDPCRPLPGTQAQRWAAVADIFFADHPPTPANMIAWAKSAGWNITIREQTDFVADISRGDEVVGESDFTWVVSILDQVITYFIADRNVGDDPLFTFPDITTLECVIRRAAPAHTQVYFIVP